MMILKNPNEELCEKGSNANQVPSTTGEVSSTQAKGRASPSDEDRKAMRRSGRKAEQRRRKETTNMSSPFS